VTEDLVFMLDAMGISTGIDLPKLLKVREILATRFRESRFTALPRMRAFHSALLEPLHDGSGAAGWAQGRRVHAHGHGPAVGAILAGMGAEVVRVEPIGGDRTRNLLGSGAGYFPMYNRHKASICLDLKHLEGVEVARRLARAPT
jgi:hypothetical protein